LICALITLYTPYSGVLQFAILVNLHFLKFN
jgi:hypothetical protein